MTKHAYYTPEGTLLVIQGRTTGMNVLVPDSMTITAIQNHIKELGEWLGVET